MTVAMPILPKIVCTLLPDHPEVGLELYPNRFATNAEGQPQRQVVLLRFSGNNMYVYLSVACFLKQVPDDGSPPHLLETAPPGRS